MADFGDYEKQPLTKIIALQVDVGGHSRWVAEQFEESYTGPRRARAELADNLERDLRSLGFQRVFWAGDGGLFAQVLESTPNLLDIEGAVFGAFARWKGEEPSRQELSFRVSATLMDCSLAADPSHWCAPDLNEFLKYERVLGQENAFVITGSLRAALGPEGQLRFPPHLRRRVQLPSKEVQVYRSAGSSINPPITDETFKSWLSSREGAVPLLRKNKDQQFEIGDVILLDAAPFPDGYGPIKLRHCKDLSATDGVRPEDLQSLSKKREGLDAEGTSARMLSFDPRLIDSQSRVDICTINYNDARAFHLLLQEQEELRPHYVETARRVMTDRARIPSIVAVAVLVILSSDEGAPLLLLARRRGRQEADGGYYPGSWAVSVGEQLIPVLEDRNGKQLLPDETIQSAASRAVQEELTGQLVDPFRSIEVHAIYLERQLANFCFLAIADLSDMRFSQLASKWLTAPDSAEHDILAGIPLGSSSISVLLDSSEIPPEVLATAYEGGVVMTQYGAEIRAKDKAMLQPSSHARLVAAMWAAERLGLS